MVQGEGPPLESLNFSVYDTILVNVKIKEIHY